ncbi:MAG TPA: hypothetical protein PLL72_23300, partial [Burkholderiaceae bacterium]|nr:hypothetical protein [Burkholderiaceae bacterium]
MNTPTMSRLESDVRTACLRLAERLGLGPGVTPVVIGRHSNLALRLDPVRRHADDRLADGDRRARAYRHARRRGAFARRRAGAISV